MFYACSSKFFYSISAPPKINETYLKTIRASVLHKLNYSCVDDLVLESCKQWWVLLYNFLQEKRIHRNRCIAQFCDWTTEPDVFYSWNAPTHFQWINIVGGAENVSDIQNELKNVSQECVVREIPCNYLCHTFQSKLRNKSHKV